MDTNATEYIDCDNLLGSDSPLGNPYVQGAVYTMYAVIFVVAFIGNSFVCYIVLSSPRMRTVTNFFIMNLAIGDMLITILCVPFTPVALLKQYWQFGSFLCPVVNYFQALSIFVSAYTLVAISIDKFMVIMWPLKPRISKRFATTVIALIWLIAGITVIPSATFAKLQQPNTTEHIYCDRYICQEDFSTVGKEYFDLYSHILMVLHYVIPLIVLLFTYTSIAAVIWCHRIPGEAENSRDRRIARSKRKMIKMMVTVVVVYTICWLPYNILMIFVEVISPRIMTFLYFPLHGLAMSHACYNPVIYCLMNTRFRDGLFVLLRIIPCCRGCFRRSSNFPPTGIGYESALEFAKRGARIILACRDEKRANEAKERIIRETQNNNIIVRIVDFASLESVRKFAKLILETEPRLDILVNNAGANGVADKTTQDGLQILMQINYFGPALLTLLLIDLLKKSAPSRIVNVSSLAGKFGKLTAENLNTFPGSFQNYGNSKLGNILFTIKLAKLLEHSDVSVFSVHPGAVKTEIFRKLSGIFKVIANIMANVYMKSAEEGAQTTIYTAIERDLEIFSGGHFAECRLVGTYGSAKSIEVQDAVWNKTIELLKCTELVKESLYK